MTGPPNKRQKREHYQQAQQAVNDGGQIELPKKRFYRQRAHANPFSDHNLTYPASPSQMDWSTHFPAFVSSDQDVNAGHPFPVTKQVEIADIGCGFGGLLVALSPLFPDTLMIGMELRAQVLSYVTNRIRALRSQHQKAPPSQPPTQPEHPSRLPPAGPYQNISALRTNAMKHLPNFFHRHQLTHLFLCFPDPHFKARKHKARIVSAQLNAEYAYVVRPGGCVYTITDVEDLAGWMERHFEGRSTQNEQDVGEGDVGGRPSALGGRGVAELWERVAEEDLERDPCVRVMREETEEGKKVSRNGGTKFVAVWRRRDDPPWPSEHAGCGSGGIEP